MPEARPWKPRPRPRTHEVRTAARALIIRDGRLLAVSMRNAKGRFYILPGGGQHAGETLQQTLLRECREEIGCHVIVRDLLYLREYIGKNHNFSPHHRAFHQLEVVFRCELPPECDPCNGPNRDNMQEGVAWLELDKIDSYPFFPKAIKHCFTGDGIRVDPLYMGDIN